MCLYFFQRLRCVTRGCLIVFWISLCCSLLGNQFNIMLIFGLIDIGILLTWLIKRSYQSISSIFWCEKSKNEQICIDFISATLCTSKYKTTENNRGIVPWMIPDKRITLLRENSDLHYLSERRKRLSHKVFCLKRAVWVASKSTKNEHAY